MWQPADRPVNRAARRPTRSPTGLVTGAIRAAARGLLAHDRPKARSLTGQPGAFPGPTGHLTGPPPRPAHAPVARPRAAWAPRRSALMGRRGPRGQASPPRAACGCLPPKRTTAQPRSVGRSDRAGLRPLRPRLRSTGLLAGWATF